MAVPPGLSDRQSDLFPWKKESKDFTKTSPGELTGGLISSDRLYSFTRNSAVILYTL